MTSHEYAREITKIAAGLLDRPEFDMPDYYSPTYKKSYMVLDYFGDKKRFLLAAKAIGTATKGGNDEDYVLIPQFAPMLQVRANRNAVCRVVKPAVPAEYECDPLLSPQEEAQVGGSRG